MANLKIRIEGVICKPPILDVVNEITTKQFDVAWNYDGMDYSSDVTTAVSIYVSTDNVTYEEIPTLYDYPETHGLIDLSAKEWEIFYFKVRLRNRNCDEYSNVIMKSI